MTETLLELRGVRKAFGNNVVLNNINLIVPEHKVFVLIGQSGSGKSTLLRCINLLERINDGQIFLSGEDISDPRINVDKVRARIGLVFQQFNLFPHLSVLDNVTLASREVFGVPKEQANEHGLDLLRKIGIDSKAHVHPDQLSGGQQQRVAIVRAIATNPKVLLLDEVTSALDPRLVGEVLDLVLELKDQDTTILMATHEMGFARQVADQVVFLDKGELVEQGTPSEIFENPKQPALIELLARGF